ncbi:hypothetical protein LZ578_11670 [Jeotgalibaca sp. MA1X17-3]|uniref:hypothetical protein n=1 Tax=Jeotgalibaca sp. MA1X17-3 TaxID=2908211 RepID=UPI001F3DBF3C|nr:hypothetical protein [Jeotgalibaca sp. MA1X17-3]UJF15597.1 hypothetical protein LZ578_11670 [Jeotgalibaca sp. MA1X17-3]
MNKKMFQNGIFSVAALLVFATASSTVVSAHGNGDQQTMERSEGGHHMQNHSSMWEENENQEDWGNTHRSMHKSENSSWENRTESEMRTGARGSCHSSQTDDEHENSRMMQSRNWSDDHAHSQHFSHGSVENN